MEDSINNMEKVHHDTLNQEMLTLGQASCLVLGLTPTRDNRKKAKEMIEEMYLFDVTYKRSTDPLYPFVVGKRVKRLNPFEYKSYPPTPPQSPTINQLPEDFPSLSLDEPLFNKQEEGEKDNNKGQQQDGYNGDHDLVNLSLSQFLEENRMRMEGEGEISDSLMRIQQIKDTEKVQVPTHTTNISCNNSNASNNTNQIQQQALVDRQYVLNLLKKIVCLARPDSLCKYTLTWVTPPALLDILSTQISNIESLITSTELEEWILRDGFLGKQILKDVKPYGPQYGRYLYVINLRNLAPSYPNQ